MISAELVSSIEPREKYKKKFLKKRTYRIKMQKAATGDCNKKKLRCSRSVGEYFREQRGRMFIIRRCIVMLLCWHD